MRIFDERNDKPASMNVEAVRQFLESQDEGRGVNQFFGRIPANKQRALFGKVYGRGKVFIDWDTGEVSHVIKVCFGTDIHITAQDYIYQ